MHKIGIRHPHTEKITVEKNQNVSQREHSDIESCVK